MPHKHNLSKPSDQPVITGNCLSIDDTLFLENGHVLREVELWKFAVKLIEDVREGQSFFITVTIRAI